MAAPPPGHGSYTAEVPDPAQLTLFAGACLVLLVVPGPAVMYILARGVDQGRTAALVSVAGIHTGTLVHVLAAAVGLSALLAASAVAFTAVKVVGGLYLIWLGVQRLRERVPVATRVHRSRSGTLRRVYLQGALVNVLNPKTAVFFLAFLPQFVTPQRGSTALQLIVLGLVFIALGVVTDGAYALASGALGALMASRERVAAASRWLTGGTYIALGVTTAVSGGGD
jgi:threonine/homoserine/homoserine lactone efflux protein